VADVTEKQVRSSTRLAIGALVFSLVSSAFVWTYADRVADQATADAVRQSEESRKAIDAANCDLYGLLIDADNAGGPAQTPYRIKLREFLEAAYRAPGCKPPLEARVPFSTAPPTAPPATQDPTTPPPTNDPTDEPTGGPGPGN
jgi:hypothetical protein